MKIAVRLAWRDLRGHKVMAVLSVLLIAVTIVVASAALSLESLNWEKEYLESHGLQASMWTGTDSPLHQTPNGESMEASSQPFSSEQKSIELMPILQKIAAPDTVLFDPEVMQAPDQQVPPMVLDGHENADPYYPETIRVNAQNATLRSGRLPKEAEIAIDPDTALALGAHIGSTIKMWVPGAQDSTDSFQARKVSGLTSSGVVIGGTEDSLEPKTLGNFIDMGAPLVITGTEPVTWQQVKEFNSYGLVVTSLDVLNNPPDEDELYPGMTYSGSSDMRLAVLFMTIIGVLEVIFIITPAFSLSQKRNERTLAHLQAVGAQPHTLAGMMVGEGLLIGALGGILGVAGYAVLQAVLNRKFEAMMHLDWLSMAGMVVVALVLGLLASLVPAIKATHLNVVQILSHRDEWKTSGSRKGYISLGIGILVMIAAFFVFSPRGSDLSSVRAGLVLIGVLALAGAAPVFIRLVTALNSHGITAKMAGRTMTRGMHRTSAAVAAIAIMTMTAVVATAAAVTEFRNATSARIMWAPQGDARFELRAAQAGGDPQAMLDRVVTQIDSVQPVADVHTIRSVHTQDDQYFEAIDAHGSLVDIYSGTPSGGLWQFHSDTSAASFDVVVAGPDDVHMMNFLDEDAKTRVAQALAKDAILVFQNNSTIDGVRLVSYPKGYPDDEPSAASDNKAQLLTSMTAKDGLQVLRVLPTQYVTHMVVSPSLAQRMGLASRVAGAQIDFEQAPRFSDGAWQQRATAGTNGFGQLAVAAPSRYDVIQPIALAGSAVLIALFISAMLVSMLSRAARADMDTVEAVGGTPGFRRRFSTHMAFQVMMAGMIPGALIGIYGIVLARRMFGWEIINYEPVAVVLMLVVLVLGAVGIGALFPPRRRTLVRRED